MGNTNLTKAKTAKDDEFYTQFDAVATEVMAYFNYDPDQFRDKTVLLPADDPEWSAFTKFFALKFEELGLKQLIATSYNPGGRGKLFRIDGDTNSDGIVDPDDLEWTDLEGDGDFRSDEVTALRDESDIIVTNPPFSLFREFLAWIVEADKQFLLIGNMNAITYREVWPLIQSDRMWLGNGFEGGNAYFASPNAEEHKQYQPDTGLVKFRNVLWYTNLDHARRHEPLRLMTMADNLAYNARAFPEGECQSYDNYDAIEVPRTLAIPSDYDGVMGVPISFLDKYCPEQFELVGASDNGLVPDDMKLPHEINGKPKKHNEPYVEGSKVYKRIFIRRR